MAVAGASSASTLPQLPSGPSGSGGGSRLNKFVRRLYDMLQAEKGSGIVEWRRGLLVLHSTDAFAKTILPKYFNTRNFKTFRRQVSFHGIEAKRQIGGSQVWPLILLSIYFPLPFHS
jgi:HSF-type DNA-binding